MKALILAAGRGQRLKPLTDTLPKPLIEVGGHALIRHHINNLVKYGINDIVINTAHLGHLIEEHLGDGQHLNAKIRYSNEDDGALETGGGIVQALKLLGKDEPFICINADIYTDYPFDSLPPLDGKLAHLVLVENPAHNPHGDFHLNHQQEVHQGEQQKPYTYAGICVYDPALFYGYKPSRYSVTPILESAASKKLISGEVYDGTWHDIGTIERLKILKDELESKS